MTDVSLHDKLPFPPTNYHAMLCTARTMLSQDAYLSDRPSVCLSHAGILSKRLNVSSNFFTVEYSHTILVFRAKHDDNIPTGNPLTRASNALQGV